MVKLLVPKKQVNIAKGKLKALIASPDEVAKTTALELRAGKRKQRANMHTNVRAKPLVEGGRASLEEMISLLERRLEEASNAPAPPNSAGKRKHARYLMDRKEIEALSDTIEMLRTNARLLDECTAGLPPQDREQVFFSAKSFAQGCMALANGLSISRRQQGAELDDAINKPAGTANGVKAPQVAVKRAREKNMPLWIKENWKKYSTYKAIFDENQDVIKNKFGIGGREFMRKIREMRRSGELPKRKKEKSSPKPRGS